MKDVSGENCVNLSFDLKFFAFMSLLANPVWTSTSCLNMPFISRFARCSLFTNVAIVV